MIDTTESEIKILRRGDLLTAGSSQTLISKSEKETGKIAEYLLKKVIDKKIDKPIVFGLSGELGGGKTVFSRKIGKLLGVKDKITSPTFVIYNEYKITGEKWKKFLHFDLYRLGNEYEFEEIKFLEQFTPQSISCIEWPENMGKENMKKLKGRAVYLPINFKYLGTTTREVRWQK